MTEEILKRLDRLEHQIAVLVERESPKDWYTTAEFARAVGRAEFSIRDHCRLGRLRAEKRQSGRGAHRQWVLSHAELTRYRQHGLLPAPANRESLEEQSHAHG